MSETVGMNVEIALAEWMCRDDETWNHHDRTDNFPCTACWGKASRLIASGAVRDVATLADDEALVEALICQPGLWSMPNIARSALQSLAAVCPGRARCCLGGVVMWRRVRYYSRRIRGIPPSPLNMIGWSFYPDSAATEDSGWPVEGPDLDEIRRVAAEYEARYPGSTASWPKEEW